MSVTVGDYRIVHIWGLQEFISPCLLTLQTTPDATVKDMLSIQPHFSDSHPCPKQ